MNTPNTYLLGRYKNTVPFSQSLNDLIFKAYDNLITTGLLEQVEFIDVENPYSTYEEMTRDIRVGKLFISSQHCDNTIFGKASVNVMFRAVHDWLHYSNNCDFSYENELIVNYHQNIYFKSLGASQFDLDLLNIETAGQIVYHKNTGIFPTNQRAFAISELRKFGY